jgi:hypothetical protein
MISASQEDLQKEHRNLKILSKGKKLYYFRPDDEAMIQKLKPNPQNNNALNPRSVKRNLQARASISKNLF